MFIHEPIDLGYDDLVCVTPKVGSRTYESATDSNIKYPSITSVLSLQSKDAIDAWKKRVGTEIFERVAIPL